MEAIRLHRTYFYCEPCQREPAIPNWALQLTKHRKQPDVRQAAVKLTTDLLYETTCELFEELTSLPLSAYTGHEAT